MRFNRKHLAGAVFAATFSVFFMGCSSLFENLYNEDGTEKTGDDSLRTASTNEDISSGLVVIKNTDLTHNQITYSQDQDLYFVGQVPDSYSDYDVTYDNGTNVSLLGKDDPVEFRCFTNDSHATVSWSAVQTWKYVPETESCTSTDSDGNEVTYSGIKGQYSLKLDEGQSVSLAKVSSSDGSIVQADLPYGVTVVTCKITADDANYSSEYKIVLTKEYVITLADSSDQSNVTDHGIVVIKATDPSRNAINYSSTVYEYEIGDSTGADTSLDLTGRDDPVVFKCYLLDDNAELTWEARQTKKYSPVWDDDQSGVTAQTLEELESPLAFDFIEADETYSGSGLYMQYTEDGKQIVKADLPYGVTEVYATITAYNTDEDGNLSENISQYKITLTKRYVITTATSDSEGTDSGLVVLANGKEGNLIDYNASTLNYTVKTLNGGNDPVKIKFYPEEPDFTDTSWTAVQTQTYKADTTEVTNSSGVTYTIQQAGSYVDLEEEVDLISAGTLEVSQADDGSYSFVTGNLPYGTSVITVKSASQDENSSTSYTVTIYKKRISTNINIVSSDNQDLSTVTDNGLVVLSADDDYSLNHINYSSSTSDYALDVTAADNGEDGMKFRCYLADTDASLAWSVIQTAEFTPVTTTETLTDDMTGETYTQTSITGQTETECAEELTFTSTSDGDNNEITAMIPYGITKVAATITSADDETRQYIITLTRDIYDSSSSSSTGSYSLLSELNVTIVNSDDSEESAAVLSPSFDPSVTTYTLTVDETADELSIEAIAAATGADISDAKAVTKYGTVPGTDGLTVSLAGGKTRISFTVTDESGISRTYYIYVEKPEDGDTTLESLDFSPESGYSNGVKGFTFDSSYAGEDYDAASKYAMTLSADDRVDVTSVEFTAVPTNKRTVAYYGVSDSESQLPDSWSTAFTKTSQASSSLSQTVSIEDEDAETINRVLWIKTVSDEYYHYTSSGYESTKRADTTYHKVLLSKAGDANTRLTALVVVATYENKDSGGSYKTSTILTQTSSSTVGYKTSAKTVNVTTFADRLDFYLRPLDKDAEVSYKALNTSYSNGEENTSFTGYASSAVSLSKLSGECSYLNDGSDAYYTFTIGEVAEGTATSADLPNGTTTVTIGSTVYTFVKPDLSTVSYSVKTAGANGEGVYSPWEHYIYLPNSVSSIVMNLTAKQQNETISVDSCTQTADANGTAVSSAQNAGWSLHHYDVTEGENIVKWLLNVGNASETVDDYNCTQTGNTLATEIPEGTTTLKFTVTNTGASGTSSQEYIYYIIRAADSESRLNSLSFDGTSPSAFASDWADGMTSDSYYYLASSSAYAVDAGDLTVAAQAVSSGANVKITMRHSDQTDVSADASSVSAAEWDTETTLAEGTYSVSESHTMSSDDAGTLLFTVYVESGDGSSSRTYYLIVHVEADKTAQLDSLKIIQKGSDASDSNDRTILGNSFSPDTYSYSDLSASLNYVGDITITPVKYSKASITSSGLTLNGSDAVSAGYASLSDYVYTIPYESYIANMGSTFAVTYTVQAQDSSVDPVTYTVSFDIPEYTSVTETKTVSASSEYSYDVPSGYKKGLGYRFGSVIADESSVLLGKFGGIDVVGTDNLTSSSPVWYESSFAASGIQFVVNVDGTDYGVALGSDGKSTTFYKFDLSSKTVSECTGSDIPDVSLEVVPSFVYEGDTPYLQLVLNLTNGSGSTVKLGAAIDTLVGSLDESTVASNDSVEVAETNNGFTMNGSAYAFSVILKNAYGVTDVDTLWYGDYDGGDFYENIFDSTAVSSLSSGTDSAACFSWTLGSDSSYTKTIRLTMG
ncbi:cadherin-like beta sandwich domain-containing protein, partial [Treponema sp.]|uniref:cadherin-like beta sandwich domain-containing protein n=1 Tax=Treponema sp. TaxID=166 RepID=UPI0025EFAA44